jgi:hypothetical protein
VLSEVQSPVPACIASWTLIQNFNPSDNSKWSRMWGFSRDSKESCLLWKILYTRNATQQWRNPTARSSDTALFCVLCIDQTIENEIHLFWECSYAQKLWHWLFHIVSLRSGDMSHMFLDYHADPLPINTGNGQVISPGYGKVCLTVKRSKGDLKPLTLVNVRCIPSSFRNGISECILKLHGISWRCELQQFVHLPSGIEFDSVSRHNGLKSKPLTPESINFGAYE